MDSQMPTYRIFPLGDSAATIDLEKGVDEAANRLIIGWFNQLQQDPLPGMTELIPAYSSLTVYYDILAVKKKAKPGQTAFDLIKEQLEERLTEIIPHNSVNERLIRIPVCYEHEFAPDLHYLASEKNIKVEEVIKIHSNKEYKVYMLGFLPGFSYMGEVDELIAMPRKPQPHPVEAGGVGIAGKQTGIYPLNSPGGWQIIGRTPLRLFDPHSEEPTLLKDGDRVQFYPINIKEYYEIKDPG